MCCWVFQCSLCLIHGWEQIPTGQKWILAQLESYTRYLLWFVFWLKVYFFCFWGCWGEPGGNAADPGNLTIRKEGAEPTGDLEDVGVITEDAEMLHDLGNTADAVAVSFGLVYWTGASPQSWSTHLRFYKELWRKRSLDKSSGGEKQTEWIHTLSY